MARVQLKNVEKTFNKNKVLKGINVEVPDGSFMVMVGPSGCGKSTALRCIAGLEEVTGGSIFIGDEDVTSKEPKDRNIAMVFQNYALWPNMTVYQNISFGLSNIKEKLPKYDFDAMTTGELIRALKSGKKIKELVEECRDKRGKLDTDKVYLKFIDAFILSIYTAKILYGYGIQDAADPDAAAKAKAEELKKKLDGIRKSYEAKGQSLNDEYAIVSGGKVLTEERKLTKEEIDKSVRRVSRIVKIGMFMNRHPAEQQQRVAIARTLAPEPSVLFMDEPLSNLDAKLRLEMRYELQRLHVETGSTFVYVTHDQMEAMTLATKICLINNGVLQQYDAPLDVYNRPANLFVADFVGNPSINFVEAKGKEQADGSFRFTILDDLEATFRPNEPIDMDAWFRKRDQDAADLEAQRLEMLKDKKAVEKSNKDEVFKYHIAKVDESDYAVEEEPEITNEDFVLAIRPEALKLSKDGSVASTIYGAMPTGMESTVKLKIGKYLLTGVIFGGVTFKLGEETGGDIAGTDILLFDRKSGKAIAAGSLSVKG